MADCPVSPDAPGPAPWSGEIRSLVLRAWLEPGLPHLRVRVVEILPGRTERPVAVTTSIEEACHAVRIWLAGLQARGGNGTVTAR
jgi:hypothetical protein